MFMSSTTASGAASATTLNATAPSDAVRTVKPDRRSPRSSEASTSGSSSTTSTVAVT